MTRLLFVSTVCALLILLLGAGSALGSPSKAAVRVEDGRLVARFAVGKGGEACATAQLLDLADIVVARDPGSSPCPRC